MAPSGKSIAWVTRPIALKCSHPGPTLLATIYSTSVQRNCHFWSTFIVWGIAPIWPSQYPPTEPALRIFKFFKSATLLTGLLINRRLGDVAHAC